MKTTKLKNLFPYWISDKETTKIPPGKFAIFEDEDQIAKEANGNSLIFDSWRPAQSELDFYHARGFLGRCIKEGKLPPTPAQLRAAKSLVTYRSVVNLLRLIKRLWDRDGFGTDPEETNQLYNALMFVIEAYDKKEKGGR